MAILKILILILTLFIIPELLGLLVLKFIKREKNNVVFAFVIGYLIQFAIAQILTVPMIFYEVSFMNLFKIYMAIILVLSVISFVINVIRIKEIFVGIINYIKEAPKFLCIITIALILIQIYMFIGYGHIDDDDAFYVGTATTTLETNSLFQFSSATGLTGWEEHLLRYRLGPFPIYISLLSKVTSIHPAIMAHIVIPAIFVSIVYMIYGLIADELFKKNKSNVFLFLIVLNILFLWGNYSIRTNFTFLLFRIWQGKAVLANIIIPAIWLLVIKAEENGFKFLDFLLLLVLNFAADFTTTMGIALAPITVMSIIFVLEISKTNFKNLKEFKPLASLKNVTLCLISCTPSIVYGLVYFLN